jgi:tetratricopeptide (TPR) repeat protein
LTGSLIAQSLSGGLITMKSISCAWPLAILLQSLLTFAATTFAAGASQQPRVGIDTSFGDRYHEAAEAMRHRRYEQVIAKVTAALGMKPDGKNAAILYRWRGVAYEELGDFTRALADYTAAIESDAAVQHVHYYRGALYSRRGELSKAVSDLTIALRRESDKASIYGSRGFAYEKMGRLQAARGDYEQVTRLPAKEGANYSVRGKAYFALGQYKAAASDNATAKRTEGGHEFVLNCAAWFEATCPDPAFRDGRAAVGDATRACERIKWKDPQTVDTLAAAYAEAGDFDRAIKFENQALSLASVLPDESNQLREHLRLFQEHKPFRQIPKV